MTYKTNIDKEIIDGMVYCNEIGKWVDANEYLYHHCIKVAKDEQAKELQQKIANDYELDKFIDGLAEKNGITNY